jgi:nicotinamidase-related amidase
MPNLTHEIRGNDTRDASVESADMKLEVVIGYEVTVVRDATADYSDVEMHAALDVNIPNYASAIVATDEIVDSISSLSTARISVGQ